MIWDGSDHAAARYIFTQLSPLSRVLFPEIDDQLYEYNYDDNLQVEPTFYAPIIPMVLVNGSQGISTGWSTNIPKRTCFCCAALPRFPRRNYRI